MSDTRQPEFQTRQYEFAAHIRNPARNARPADVEDRRMAIYRDLFYNNVEGFLAGTFPILRKITPDERWHAMVRDYFARHDAHSPYFLDIPKEFLGYLQEEREQRADDPAFLIDLAHYEWVELALSVLDEEPDGDALDQETDVLNRHPAVSPLAWPLSYPYQVHKIGPDYLPEKPDESPTHLLVYRNKEDEVEFLELNPVSARLLDLLLDDGRPTGRAALQQIAAELQHPDPERVVNFGHDMLREWHKLGIIPGTR
jgi:hypothetical protein